MKEPLPPRLERIVDQLNAHDGWVCADVQRPLDLIARCGGNPNIVEDITLDLIGVLADELLKTGNPDGGEEE